MANMRIIHTNVVDGGVLSSTPECVASMPITNIQVAQRESIARVLNTQAWTITGEMISAVSGMALVGHNLTGGATIRLRLYSDYAKTTCVHDSGLLAVGTPQPWGNPSASPNGGLTWGLLPWLDNTYPARMQPYFCYWFTPITNAVTWQIDIEDQYQGDGYLQLNRLYIGEYWEPKINCAYGASLGWKEQSTQIRTDSGSLRTEGYMPWRTYSFQIDSLDESDRADFLEITRKVGLRQDVLINMAPGAGGERERDYTAAVKFTSLPKISAPDYGRFETASVEMEEI